MLQSIRHQRVHNTEWHRVQPQVDLSTIGRTL